MRLDSEKLSDKKVLVTGAAGFIGSHITDELIKADVHVIGIDNLYHGLLNNLENAFKSSKFTFFQSDIRDSAFLIEICRDIDLIYHEAAFTSAKQSVIMPRLCNDINVNGTINVLNAARINDVNQVIYASTAALYADDSELPKQEGMLPKPKTPYGVSKHAAEEYMISFNEIYGLNTTALRYFNVYGLRQRETDYGGVMSIFLNKIFKGDKELTIYGDGTQTRDFIYIKDIVKANLMVAYHPKSIGKVFNVATNNPVDINYLTDLIVRFSNMPNIEIQYAPKRGTDILHSYADISKIKKEIGFEPDYSIDQGIPEYISQFKNLTK
ncbi:hypothetical protein LCGC14_1662860 [marine sediment metagenome]|uniref:NAD-dependent epimerase/dehydratase domain-containing protein n=1 Tax=marine sediment metagenome TaxID=412755 RepID=A0A0F9HU98_9ZZZZ